MYLELLDTQKKIKNKQGQKMQCDHVKKGTKCH